MISLRHGLPLHIAERSILTQNAGHGEIREGILCIAGEEYQLQYDGALPWTRGSVLACSHLAFAILQRIHRNSFLRGDLGRMEMGMDRL